MNRSKYIEGVVRPEILYCDFENLFGVYPVGWYFRNRVSQHILQLRHGSVKGLYLMYNDESNGVSEALINPFKLSGYSDWYSNLETFNKVFVAIR